MNSFESTSVPTETSLSMTVINLIADADDTDPVELAPLYDTIDPDLLDSLVDSPGFSSLEFTYHGYTVAVGEVNGEIEVEIADANAPLDDAAEPDLVDTESST